MCPYQKRFFAAVDRDSHVCFARRIGVSPAALERLRQVLRNMDAMTSEELAAGLGITARSTNRIIVRLEEVGCITTVGKASAGKGRPAKVMKIALPASLNQM